MSFLDSIRIGLSKCFDPRGRATRSVFWWYYLFVSVIAIPISVALFFVIALIFNNNDLAIAIGYAIIALPSISIVLTGVRRMHDIGMSGWNLLWPTLPYFCFLLTQMYADSEWKGSLWKDFGNISWNFFSVICLFSYIIASVYVIYLLCKPSQEGENEWEYTITVEE